MHGTSRCERGPCPIHRYNLDWVCSTPRFAKWEQKEDGSWTARNITDLKASGANSTVEVLRKYCPEDLTHAWALHRAIREQMPVGTRIMGTGQIGRWPSDPTDPTQAKLLVELQWNPEWKAACAMESDGQPFGGKATQYNFIRDPQAMLATGRSALALLVSHYSDDTWGLEPDYAALHAWKIWLELHKIIGWRLDLDKSPPPEYTFRLLGADLHVGAEQPVGILPASKALQLEKDIDACLQAGTMTSAQASSLRGKFQWSRTFTWSCWGAAVLAFRTWPNLRNGLWIHFVDNEGAKFSMINGASSVLSLSPITHTIWKEARDRRLYAWIERVATADTPVDKASSRDLRDHYVENWVVDKPPRSWSQCLWEPSLVPSGWVVTGSAYPLAQRSE